MPPMVIPDKCDGCQSESEPLCQQVCPGDLMAIDKSTNKAVCLDPGDCWDCMNCTKACPRQAIETRLPYQIAFFPGKLIPMVGTHSVTWTLIDSNGLVERYVMKTVAGEDDEEH